MSPPSTVCKTTQILPYVTEIGLKLDRYSHRPDLPYVYKVMDSEVVNAFAVPGGIYVFITRGILAYLNSKAELAGVIGHEIGHVAARHSAQQYSKTQRTQVALGGGSLISETFRSYAGIQMIFLKYSRENETQSDTLGVESGFLENHAILNGVYLTDVIDQGTLVKIVVPGSVISPW